MLLFSKKKTLLTGSQEIVSFILVSVRWQISPFLTRGALGKKGDGWTLATAGECSGFPPKGTRRERCDRASPAQAPGPLLCPPSLGQNTSWADSEQGCSLLNPLSGKSEAQGTALENDPDPNVSVTLSIYLPLLGSAMSPIMEWGPG